MRTGIVRHIRPTPAPPRRVGVRPRAKISYDVGYEPEVVIVGAGLAGLACAKTLHDRSVNFALFESSSRVGGRVKTEVCEGFQLDYGFQIFLTAYPEAQKQLDYDSLRLKPFYNGAMVWHGGNFYRVADPFRHPVAGVASVFNPIGSIEDKARVGLLRLTLAAKSDDKILTDTESTTLEKLKDIGFSSSMIDRFFRPFFGGIFFDNDLRVSSRLFEFVMKTLANGDNALPERGIGELAQQLAANLPPHTLQLNRRVERVHGATDIHVMPGISLADADSRIMAKKAVVVATEGPTARELLDPSLLTAAPSKNVKGVGTCCLYFSAPKAPLNGENVLYLNGDREGIVNNCCFPSTVAASYAPPGEVLVSTSTVGTHPDVGDEDLEKAVRQQMGTWFGPFDVSSWKLLKIYRIPYAQPDQTPPTNLTRPVRLGNKVYVCGDHRDSATFDGTRTGDRRSMFVRSGALKSGRRAAEAVISDAIR